MFALSNSEFGKIPKRLVTESSGGAHGHIIEMTDANFDKIVNGGKVALVDFWAAWCGPCKTMEPIIDRLAAKFSSSVTFGKLNVDKNSGSVTKFEVQSVPTFMIFKNGAPVDAVIGTIPEAALEQRIRKVAGS